MGERRKCIWRRKPERRKRKSKKTKEMHMEPRGRTVEKHEVEAAGGGEHTRRDEE